MAEWIVKTENYSDIFKEHVIGELYTTAAIEVTPDAAKDMPIGSPISADGKSWDKIAPDDVIGLLGVRLPAGTDAVRVPVLVRGVVFDKNQIPWPADAARVDIDKALAALARLTLVPIDGDKVPYDFGR